MSTEPKVSFTVDQIIELVRSNTNIGSKQIAKLRTDLLKTSNKAEFFTNRLVLTRSLLALGLPVKTVAVIVGIDSDDVNTNNIARSGRGEKVNYTIEKLVVDPEYNQRLTTEEFEKLKNMHPNAALFENNIVEGKEPLEKKELRTLTKHLLANR